MTVPVCLFTGAVACLLFVANTADSDAAHKLIGNSVRVEAVVAESPYMKKDNARHYCVLDLEAVDGKAVSGRLRLSFSPSKDKIEEDSLEIGNRISFRGKVYIPGEGEKSIGRYFAGERIVLGAYSAREIIIEAPARRGVEYWFSQIRNYVSRKLDYGFDGKIAGFLTGMLTGDKSGIDSDLYDSLRKTGVAHLMAVSGFHLSLWVFVLGMLIPESSKTARLKYLFLALAVVFIMLLAGMSESVKRAGVMSLVYLAGKLSKRRSDSLNSLGLALTIMMLYNPACVLSLSMQLSFLSTLGIVTLGVRFMKLTQEAFGRIKINLTLKKLLVAAADTFFISISVLVFTFPVLINAFGGISSVSAWVNILVSPVAAPLLLLSGIYVIFSSVSFVAFPVSVVVAMLAKYVIAATDFFDDFRNAFLVFEAETILLYVAGGVLVSFMCLAALSNKFRSIAAFAMSLIISFSLIAVNRSLEADNLKIYLASYDDCVAVAAEKDKSAMLLNRVDKYEKGLFKSSLDEKGVRLDGEIDYYGRFFLKSALDGKYLTSGESLQLFDEVTVKGNADEHILELSGKYIHIFYSEALQCDCGCDIMIKIIGNDAIVSTDEMSISLKKEGSLILVLTDNKTILRGENPWLNLMKSS